MQIPKAMPQIMKKMESAAPKAAAHHAPAASPKAPAHNPPPGAGAKLNRHA